MALRPTMADLIRRLRTLIGDPAGPTMAWADLDLQDALDRTQSVVRYAPLAATWTQAPGGITQYLDYYAQGGDWEADAVVVGGTYSPLTPTTTDYLNGHWTFASSTLPPVFLIGKTYDTYAAAADVLETWAAQLARQFDVTSERNQYQRSQQATALLEAAARHRQQARVRSLPQVRSDDQGVASAPGAYGYF